MRILFLTQTVPNLSASGSKGRTDNVLRYLVQRHEVHVASLVRSAQDNANARYLRDIGASVTTVPLRRSRVRDATHLLASLASGRPFLIERDDSSAMRDAIAELVHRHAFDAVHADQLSTAQFAVRMPLPLRILDAHDAVWKIAQRAARWQGYGPGRAVAELEWRKLRNYEGQVCRQFDLVLVASNQDYVALAEAARAVFPTEVIPMAVDLEPLAFLPRGPDARHVVSLATLSYSPNVEGVHWFARDVFPLIRQEVPQTHFFIVGSRPPPKITRLARPDTGIAVTGYLADLEPILGQSAVMVVPVHAASRMRLKILQAFARGIPVVSTTIGIEGIDARNGEHLLIADDPAEFAQAVIRLLRQPGEARRLTVTARALVEARYDWRTALAGLDKVYKPIAPGAGEPRLLGRV